MAVDLSRRKAVMARSIRLGRCVCNPKNPCPCGTFKEHNVCPCAGEKMPARHSGPVALTRHVRKVGCASKIGQADLLRVLKRLPPVVDPDILVGTAAGDDAGVYRINDRQALVQTVDVFTPVVDDPFLFGQIAAANSLSDIYAMGGRPLTALSIIGFPIENLDDSVMEAILRGGMEKLAEAGCALLGGHSLIDEEIKCGFAVTGLMEIAQVVERNRARTGDALVLTKPLGTGMAAFGAQIGRISASQLAQAGASMAELNRDAAELMVEMDAHACTDITGFGLAGHLAEMARGSGVSVEIDLEALPVFEAALYCLDHQILPGAIERNQEYSMAWVKPGDECDESCLPILYDPQTSGGLLIALPPAQAERFIKQMRARGHGAVSTIGRVLGPSAGEVLVTGERLRKPCADADAGPDPAQPNPSSFRHMGSSLLAAWPDGSKLSDKFEPSDPSDMPGHADRQERSMSPHSHREANPMTEHPESCCAGGNSSRADEAGRKAASSQAGDAPSDAFDLFGDFMKAANREGAVDKRAKKLMAIALSISHRCAPCLEIHMRGALAMGIAKAEIDEAAQLALVFGGGPALMLYREVCKEMGL